MSGCNQGMIAWLRTYCCCSCCEEDEEEERLLIRPYVVPKSSEQEEQEEIMRLREQLRLADLKMEMEAKQRRENREITSTELAIQKIGRFGTCELSIDQEAVKAWSNVLGEGAPPFETVLNYLLAQDLPIELKDNLSIQLNKFNSGVGLTINVKQSNALPEDRKSWDRMAAQLSLMRTFERREGELIVEEMRTDMRGGGAKVLYRKLLPLYLKLGVTQIELEADEVGSYAWVRYGFRPKLKGKNSWQELCEKLRGTVQRLEEKIGNSLQVKEIYRLLESNDPATIVQIADLKNDNFEGGKLGFVILHRNIWAGYLDLRDQNAVAMMEKYINL